jgi:hypothetical protein
MTTAAAEFLHVKRRAAELPASYHRRGRMSEKNQACGVKFDDNGNPWSKFALCDILQKFPN